MPEFVDERRFAPPIREYRNDGRGPTGQWQRHQATAAEREGMARLLWREGWTATEIADYLGVARSWVRQQVTAMDAA